MELVLYIQRNKYSEAAIHFRKRRIDTPRSDQVPVLFDSPQRPLQKPAYFVLVLVAFGLIF